MCTGGLIKDLSTQREYKTSLAENVGKDGSQTPSYMAIKEHDVWQMRLMQDREEIHYCKLFINWWIRWPLRDLT